METPKHRKRDYIRYELNPEEVTTMQLLIEDAITTREAASRIGVSHEQVIHMSFSLSRQWLKNGILKFSDAFLNRGPSRPPNS